MDQVHYVLRISVFPPVRVPRWLADTMFFLGFQVSGTASKVKEPSA